MFADLSLENRALKDVIEKTLKPAFKRELVTHLITTFGLSIRQATLIPSRNNWRQTLRTLYT